MPKRLDPTTTSRDRARRHVLGQQLYRLRRRRKFLWNVGAMSLAHDVSVHIWAKQMEYRELGGALRPKRHRVQA
jgi:hypothetical protein